MQNIEGIKITPSIMFIAHPAYLGTGHEHNVFANLMSWFHEKMTCGLLVRACFQWSINDFEQDEYQIESWWEKTSISF